MIRSHYTPVYDKLSLQCHDMLSTQVLEGCPLVEYRWNYPHKCGQGISSKGLLWESVDCISVCSTNQECRENHHSRQNKKGIPKELILITTFKTLWVCLQWVLVEFFVYGEFFVTWALLDIAWLGLRGITLARHAIIRWGWIGTGAVASLGSSSATNRTACPRSPSRPFPVNCHKEFNQETCQGERAAQC